MTSVLRVFLIVTISLLSNDFFAGEKRVLVLHSYHQGLEWTDSLNEGIMETFKDAKDSIEIVYHYLDLKRNTSPEYRKRLLDFYKFKEIKNRYDVILSCDNDALNILLDHRDEFYKEIPIVFCGINNYKDSIIAGHDKITGIIEQPDYKSTINLVLSLHPEVENLHVINDDKTTTSLENLGIIKRLEPQYKNQLKFHYLIDYTVPEIKQKITKLTNKDAVLLSTFSQDRNGKFISYKGMKAIVPENNKIPIYAVWEFYGKNIVVGGKMLSGKYQGAFAATKALEILSGENVEDMPINVDSLSRYTFYYNQLKSHNINKNKLPNNSIILYRSEENYSRNSVLIVMAIVIVLALLIIMILGISNSRKNKLGISLLRKQEYLQKSFRFQKMHANVVTLLNSTSDFKIVLDDVLQIIINYYPIDQISIYKLKMNVGEVGNRISTRGSFIDLTPADFRRLSRIIGIIEGLGFYSTNDLSNLNDDEKQFCREKKLASFCLFAVKIEDRMLGIAGFVQKKTFDWNRQLIEELGTFVSLIASAWERSGQVAKRIEAEKENLKATQVLEQSARLSTIGVIASGLTHEINQPLNALRVTVDAIKYWKKVNEGGIPEIIDKKLNTLSKGIERIDNIIKHMRTYWIASEDEQSAEAIDFNEAARNAYGLIENQVKENNINLILSLPEDKVVVKANQSQIEQIIINLVVNSIQAFKKSEKGEKNIEVEVTESGNYVILIVSDNATGIDPDIGERLFDPFFSTKIIEEGTGLGLALVKSFVEKIDGRVDYLNNELGGVSFFVSINRKLNS